MSRAILRIREFFSLKNESFSRFYPLGENVYFDRYLKISYIIIFLLFIPGVLILFLPITNIYIDRLHEIFLEVRFYFPEFSAKIAGMESIEYGRGYKYLIMFLLSVCVFFVSGMISIIYSLVYWNPLSNYLSKNEYKRFACSIVFMLVAIWFFISDAESKNHISRANIARSSFNVVLVAPNFMAISLLVFYWSGIFFKIMKYRGK